MKRGPMPHLSKTHYQRAVQATVAAVLAASAVCVGSIAPTRASVIDVECLGTSSLSFSPALTITTQSLTVTQSDNYNTCLIGPTATGTSSISATFSCLNIGAGPALTETITWNDATGGTSTINWQPPTIVATTV